MANKGKQASQSLFDNIVNTVKELPHKMMEIGKNIVKGIWNGITSMGNWIGDKVSSFFKGIVDGAKNALGIHSPSTVFRDEIGKFMAMGIPEGFEKQIIPATKRIQEALTNQVGNLKNAISENIILKDSSADIEPKAYSILGNNMQFQNMQNGLQLDSSFTTISMYLQKLTDILLIYFPQFTDLMNKEIVLEDGTVAGYLTPIIDRNLSNEQNRKRRGN